MRRASDARTVGIWTPALAFGAALLGAPAAASACGPPVEILIGLAAVATAATWVPAGVVAGVFAFKGWRRAAFVSFPVTAALAAVGLGNVLIVAGAPEGPGAVTDGSFWRGYYAEALPVLLGASVADAVLATAAAGAIVGARWAWRRMGR